MPGRRASTFSPSTRRPTEPEPIAASVEHRHDRRRGPGCSAKSHVRSRQRRWRFGSTWRLGRTTLACSAEQDEPRSSTARCPRASRRRAIAPSVARPCRGSSAGRGRARRSIAAAPRQARVHADARRRRRLNTDEPGDPRLRIRGDEACCATRACATSPAVDAASAIASAVQPIEPAGRSSRPARTELGTCSVDLPAWSRSTSPQGVEERWQRTWEEEGLYNAEPGSGRETFVVAHPPPNVTGELHIGHALQISLADALVRWHRMRGFERLSAAGLRPRGHLDAERGREAPRRRGQDAPGARPRGVRRALVWEWLREYGGTIMSQFRPHGRLAGLPARALHDGRRLRRAR